MISTKLLAMLAAAFAAGAFFASPLPEAIASTIANDVICSGCVGTSDLAGNAITAAKIKDGEVKAAEIAASAVGSSEIATDAVGASEIAANSVGASELKGVTKLIFTECTISANSAIPSGNAVLQNCAVQGVTTNDNVIATKNAGNGCFKIVTAQANQENNIFIIWRNDCASSQALGVGIVSVIVYNT